MPIKSDSLAKIHSRLAEAQALLQQEDSDNDIHDFAGLKLHVFKLDLEEEITALDALFQQDNARVLFLERWKQRATQNKNTCLDLLASPESPCNKLYWDLSIILFNPKSLSEQLSILLPEITSRVSFNTFAPTARKHKTADLRLNLQEIPLESLNDDNQPLLPSSLSNYATGGSFIFSVTDMVHLNFDLHQQLYASLKEYYPDLANGVYQHNPELRQLHNHIQLLEGQNALPMQVIQFFAVQLRLAGERINGSEYAAASSAHDALYNFQLYLDSLPPEFKQLLMQLKDKAADETLLSVMEDLYAGSCVETAANDLHSILENPVNKRLLNTHSTLPAHHIDYIKRTYAKKTQPLPSSQNHGETNLPENLVNRAIQNLYITTFNDVLTLLLNLPTNLYKSILQLVEVASLEELSLYDDDGLLNEELVYILKFVLNEEQRRAFILASPSPSIAFSLALLCDEITLCEQLYPGLPHTEIPIHQLLLNIIPQVETLRYFLNILPQETRDSVLINPVSEYSFLLKMALSHHESLRVLLEIYPEALRLQALLDKNDAGFSTLHAALEEPESLRVMLELCPENLRLQVLLDKGDSGYSILHRAFDRPESLRVMLELCPEASRLEALLDKSRSGHSPLHLAFDYPESLSVMLELCPEESRLAALLDKSGSGYSTLHRAFEHPESLRVMLELCPEASRLTALLDKSRDGYSALRIAHQKPESFRILLESCPEASFIEALIDKDRDGHSVLHGSVQNPDYLRMILSRCPEAARLLALTDKNINGNSVLRLAWRNPESLRALLELCPQESRLAALNDKGSQNLSALDMAYQNPESWKVVLELCPEAATDYAFVFLCLAGLAAAAATAVYIDSSVLLVSLVAGIINGVLTIGAGLAIYATGLAIYGLFGSSGAGNSQLNSEVELEPVSQTIPSA